MPGNANISRLVELEIRGVGADSVTILAQATRELKAEFAAAVEQFKIDGIATKLIAQLNSIAGGMTRVAEIANSDAVAMARAAAETDKYIEKTTAALNKKDAEEARLDAQSRARMDAKAAKDKAALDAIGAAADKAAKAAQKAADDMAASDARKEAANAKALADAEGYEAMQRKLGEMERRTAQETRDAVASTTAARQHGTEAIASFIAKVREEVAAEQAERASQVQTTAATREQIQAMKDLGVIQSTVVASTRSGTGAFGGFATAAEQAADKNKRMGYAMLNVSYAVQDLQYGMGAVANNIGLVTQSIGNAIPKFASMTSIIGGPAGLGAILMGAGVFADILYHNWETLGRVFGQGKVKSQAEEMEELGKKTEKTADETQRLAKYEEQREHIKKQGEKPEAVVAFGAAVDKAIREGPLADIDKGIDKYFGNRIQTMADVDPRTKEADEELAAAKRQYEYSRANNLPGSLPGGALELKLQEAQRAKDAIYAEAREKFRGDLPTKPGTVEEMAKAATAHPEDFGKGGKEFAASLREAVDSSTPEKVARRKQIDADYEAAIEEGDQAAKDVKERFADLRKKAKLEDKEEEFWRKRDEEVANHFEKWANRMGDKDDKEGSREAKDIQKEKDDEIKKLAAQQGPGMEGALIAKMVEHMGRGATADQSYNQLLPQVARMLRDQGIPLTQGGLVAPIILQKAADKAGAKVMGGGLAAGTEDRVDAAQGLAADAQRKQAEDQRRHLKATLQTQAMLDYQMGFAGEASLMLAQIEANERRQRQQQQLLQGRVNNTKRRPNKTGPR